jgi:MarR family transcriptional regulator, lower aerobic nicotinate degradation pathway regulator
LFATVRGLNFERTVMAKKKRKQARGNTESTPERGRQNWLRALTAVDDPGHTSPTLVLYRLLKLSNMITRPFFADESERYDISVNELRVLMTLAPLREAASHELGVVAAMHPMNVSRAVAALRRQGRLQQQPDPNNRRRKLLKLTKEGWALYQNLMPHVQQVADNLFGDMSSEDIRQLSRYIDIMTEHLNTADAAAGLQNEGPAPEE